MKLKKTYLSILAFLVVSATTINAQKSIDNFFFQINNGSFNHSVEDKNFTQSDVERNLAKWFLLDKNYSFEQLKGHTDKLGYSHVNYKPMYKGYAIDDAIVMLHQKNGKVTYINGTMRKVGNIDVIDRISEEQAFEIAVKKMNITKLLEKEIETVVATIYRDEGTIRRLAKKVRVLSIVPLVHSILYIDAETGEVLKIMDQIKFADIPGTAHTRFYGEREIVCHQTSPNTYLLKDSARKIGTYDGTTWDGSSLPSEDILFSNNTTTWSNNPALDVHWGMKKTYDYYLETFNRRSYDNEGGEVYNVYNPVALDRIGVATNAASLGRGLMVYGRGGAGLHPLVAIDVAGHEYTHLVIEKSNGGGLTYSGESGALNESFADIFGTSIEFYANVNPDWLIGEDVMIGGGSIRNMSDPKNTGRGVSNPNTYRGDFWADTRPNAPDKGGVHINSGVQNFWFYLLSEGGTGTNDKRVDYSVSGIGIDDAQRIAYRSLMEYMPQNANYIDSYNCSKRAALDLFGANSNQYRAVVEAWRAVGIDEDTAQPFCEGTSYLTQKSGTITDGMGDTHYRNEELCRWVITPCSPTYITIKFSSFNTELNRDFVRIYDNDRTLINSFSGTTIPDSVTINSSRMIVEFESNENITAPGFVATFDSDGADKACSGTTVLQEASGTFGDGSVRDYCNNQLCKWIIRTEQQGHAITLNFTEFDLEPMPSDTKYYDFVAVFDGETMTSPSLGKWGGNTIPPSVTANSGKMLIVFVTDEGAVANGFTANYTTAYTNLDTPQNDNSVKIFPNPTKDGNVNIEILNLKSGAKLLVYDMFGKQVFSQRVVKTTSSIDVSFLNNGIYTLKIENDNNAIFKKLIVSK